MLSATISIAVAGGGGGATGDDGYANGVAVGGDAGYPNGAPGDPGNSYTPGVGGTAVLGGSSGNFCSSINAGTFGYGGNSCADGTQSFGGSGGGGYYGGGGAVSRNYKKLFFCLSTFF